MILKTFLALVLVCAFQSAYAAGPCFQCEASGRQISDDQKNENKRLERIGRIQSQSCVGEEIIGQDPKLFFFVTSIDDELKSIEIQEDEISDQCRFTFTPQEVDTFLYYYTVTETYSPPSRLVKKIEGLSATANVFYNRDAYPIMRSGLMDLRDKFLRDFPFQFR